MSEPCPVVFDISSDEEPAAFDESSVRDDEDPNWLSELLGIVDKERKNVDDDEVVVVEEYNFKSKSKSTKPVKGGVNRDDDDDDDCIVLDGDPDKVVNVVGGGDGDGDDVVVVGQKGQIACRDYPHPRHDCAKFPFSSTPHESHCDLCHCYVCDLRAPCAFWGTGLSTGDHCHANNKNEIWKSQRENLRLQKNAPLPVLKPPNPPPLVVASQMTPVTPDERFDALQLELRSLLHSQPAQPTTIRACSSNRMAIPNIISQRRNTESGYGQGRNGLLPHLVPKQVTGVQPNVVRRGTVPNVGRQFVSSSTMFKKPGIIRGALATNQATRCSSNNKNCVPASQHRRNTVPLPTSMVPTPNSRPDTRNLESYAYPGQTDSGIVSFTANPMPPRPQVYSQPIPQSNGQDIYQSQNISDLRSDIGISWGNTPSQSNQQTSIENVPLSGLGNNNVTLPINDFPSTFTGNTQFDDCENWFSSHSVAQPGSFSADLNAFCPEPPAIDAGMLYFDYDASFNGLAQV